VATQGWCVMITTTVTRPTDANERQACMEDGLRAKMLRELELDLSYALRREGEARRAWGMRHVPGLAKVNGSGDFRFYPSP
jgi:hypothetical protein